jgi:hypothetical protein
MVECSILSAIVITGDPSLMDAELSDFVEVLEVEVPPLVYLRVDVSDYSCGDVVQLYSEVRMGHKSRVLLSGERIGFELSDLIHVGREVAQ